MKKYFILHSLICFGFSIAVPPQNEADRYLLRSCQSLYQFGIAQALCLGANKEVTQADGETLSSIIRGDEFQQRLMSRSIDFTDQVRGCQMALCDYPKYLIQDFELVDKKEHPQYSYPTCLRLGIVNGVDYCGDTIIHRAIRTGEANDNVVKKIIGLRGWFNFTPDGINEQNNNGDTPLHLVMKSSEDIRSHESRKRLCLFLVSRGANAAIKNKKGETPITYDVRFWLSLCSSMKRSEGLCSKVNRLVFCRKRAA